MIAFWRVGNHSFQHGVTDVEECWEPRVILYFFLYSIHFSKAFLVCPIKHAAVLVNVDGVHSTVPLDDEVSAFIHLWGKLPFSLFFSPPIFHLLLSHFQSDLNIVASFDRRGGHIYTGNAKGKVRNSLFASRAHHTPLEHYRRYWLVQVKHVDERGKAKAVSGC